ncbi:MAG: hypothetical protein HQ534_08745 [Armatimonadetes bacterium]|nr:hypothetical protein [Armatimonadota bacterium]
MKFPGPLEIVEKVTSIFDSLNIPYFIGGSLASSLQGIPRATQDIDFIADINNTIIPKLIDAFKEEFYIDENMVEEAIEHKSSFNIIHLKTIYKADIFVPDNRAFQDEMSRRVHYFIPDKINKEIFIASAEDIIIQKLRWFRLGGEVSEKQWNDVLGVVRVQFDKLDLNYLKTQSEKYDLTILLEKVLDDSKLSKSKM